MQTIHKVVAAMVSGLALASAAVRAQEVPPVVGSGTAPVAAKSSSDDAKVRAAMHPPGLSLEFKQATPSEVLAALNKALGATVVTGQGRGISRVAGAGRGGGMGGADTISDAGVRFTLKCDNMPLWEVLKQLDRQSAMGVQRMPGGTVVDFGRSDIGGRPYPLNGEPLKSMVVVPEAPALALRARIYNFFNQRTPEPERWTMPVTLLADPRARICRAQAVIKAVTDDQGKTFDLPVVQAKDVAPSVGEFVQELTIARASAVARSAKITGEAHVWVVLEEETRVIGELNDNLGKPIEMKGGTVTFDKFAAPRGADPPVILISRLTRSTPPGAEEWPVEFCTTSSNGTVMAGLVGGGGRISGGGVLAIPSGRLQVNWVLRAKEVVVPFEIPDVPLEAR